MVAATARFIPQSLHVDALLVAGDGAPAAVQVADRWHLVDNLADAMDDVFRSKGVCLTAAAAALIAQANGQEKDDDSASPPSDAISQGKRRHPQPERWCDRVDAAAEAGVARRRANYEQARVLHANCATNAAIARTVGIGYRTVYRSRHQDPPVRKRRSDDGQRRVITPDAPFLRQRWAEGCRTATVLWREIQAQGLASSLTNVQRFVSELRRAGPFADRSVAHNPHPTTRPAAPSGGGDRSSPPRTAER